jgi:XRE family transcriptional regulator, regulator of sulfur utilization
MTRRDLIVGIIASGLTLAAVAAADNAKAVLHSTVFHWKTLEARKTDKGYLRDVVRQPTATLDELEMHITTLNPGESSHEPHKHFNEELVIIKEGTVEVLNNGQHIRTGPGSIIFNGSNELHSLRNIGSTPAMYWVINWKAPSSSGR